MSETETLDIKRGIDRDSTFPRAVVHKRILDVAKSRPEASMEAIAEDVTGATTALVEQVLDEYGDPGRTDGDTTDEAASTGAADHESTTDADDDTPPDGGAMSDRADGGDDLTPDPTDVTEKQLETLREIREHPHATQAALADRLDVSSATISQRVNGIDGFDWGERKAFVERFFDQDGSALEERGTETDSDENAFEETAAGTDSDADAADEPDETPDDEAAVAVASDDDTADTAIGADQATALDERTEDTLESVAGTVDTALGDGGDVGPESAADTERESADAEAGPDADCPETRGGKPSDTVGREEAGGTRTQRATDATGARSDPPGQSASGTQSGAPLADHVAELTARIETLEQRLEGGYSVDPELAHKVIRACFHSNQISTDEEILVLEGILAADSPVMSVGDGSDGTSQKPTAGESAE